MTEEKEQKPRKENPNNNPKAKKKSFNPPFENKQKPFEQFSNPNKFKGGPPKSFNNFHRRLGQ